MQISEEVHNYMETLVGQVLSQPEYVEPFTHTQLSDLACLALSQLRPIYIRYDVDFLSALPEERLVQLKNDAETAVENAKGMILDDRRQGRVEDIPVLFTKQKFDEDAELEWYETPILPTKS